MLLQPAQDLFDVLDTAAEEEERKLKDQPDAKLETRKRGACLATAEGKST